MSPLRLLSRHAHISPEHGTSLEEGTVNALDQLSYIRKNYSTRLAMTKAMTTVAAQLGKFTHFYPAALYDYSSNIVEKQLLSKYGDFLSTWIMAHPEETATPFTTQAPHAWMCWLQGEDDLPPLLQRITNVQKHMLEDYQYTVISLENIDDYVEFPAYIHDKFRAGDISPVHMTDLMRVALLEQYGGLWIDATVLLTQPVPHSIFESPFYTIKDLDTHFAQSQKYPEIRRWEGYMIAGQPHALLYSWMKDFLFNYWKHETRLIHYLMINQAALIGIDNIPIIQDEYMQLPSSNRSCELLAPQLKSGQFNSLDALIRDGTYAFKLSRHVPYEETALSTLFATIHA